VVSEPSQTSLGADHALNRIADALERIESKLFPEEDPKNIPSKIKIFEEAKKRLKESSKP
jgi:hypothetical protein